jgi:polynucleotide 5'-hydroxyl-kinase GRC3/NOL9
MLAYFDIGDQLFGMRSTYRVPMASMRVHFMDSEVLPSQSLLALNASVVALVADDSTTVVFNGGRNTMSRQLPQFLLSSPTARSSSCLGLGVIKSIDIEQQVLYIVTPVAAEQLKGVNTIIKASLDLPQLVLVKDVTINTPYLTADSISSLGTGATHMKSRGNILRHRYDAKTNQ